MAASDDRKALQIGNSDRPYQRHFQSSLLILCTEPVQAFASDYGTLDHHGRADIRAEAFIAHIESAQSRTSVNG
jgi:hypothetical protein